VSLEHKFCDSYVVRVVVGLISVWFNRGRVFFSSLILLTAYLLYRLSLSGEMEPDVAARAFAMLCVLVPLNLAALTLLPERGLFNAFGLRRLLIIALQLAAVGLLLVRHFYDGPDFLFAPRPQLNWIHATTIPPRVLAVILLALVPPRVRAR